MNRRTVLDSVLRKLPSSRKYYQVSLVVSDSGLPVIEYSQANASSKKPKKTIPFVDLLFADKKHDTDEKFAFSVYATDRTVTFLARDETIMNEWLTRIREFHSDLYPEFKRYDSIFEANLLDKGLAKTMNIHGQYRLALCKESLDLIPLLNTPHLLSKQQNLVTTTTNKDQETKIPSSHHIFQAPVATTMNPLNSSTTISPHTNTHHHLPQHLPSHQRFDKRHPLLKSNTIELALRSIRRCGHTHNSSNFYIESGRHSQIGEGDLWMTLTKKHVARQLHELLLATMKLASAAENNLPHKGPRSRSGSSSENAARSQQSCSSSLVCLNADMTNSSNNNNTISNHNFPISQAQTTAAPVTMATNNVSTIPMFSNNINNNCIEEDGYLPMA